MVTLLGFFFILGNVGLLVIFMPDLIGPVRAPPFPENSIDTFVLTIYPGPRLALL